MLFYSFEFLFLFLPAVLGIFFYTEVRFGRRAAIIVLVLSSLIFYGSWNPVFVPILCASVVTNYFLGCFLQGRPSKALLWAGVGANLALLGYFKYAGFFLGVVNAVADTHWQMQKVVLPLGISFYTFQQISWLVDSYAAEVDTRKEGFWRYALFVCFFPHLVAGPLVDHSEMMPQFSKDSNFKPKWSSLAIGISIFVIGLAKKVILADEFGATATPVFADAAHGLVPFSSAWLAALCYTFQVYFDFSGYSDMAVGLARMFNIRLPMNFNSPFKAASIIDFWKRWHMTMTRFFQTYIYTPLSVSLMRRKSRRGARGGDSAIYIATMATLLAIGLWHGANWTFVIFGLLQGIAIILNYLWRASRKRRNLPLLHPVAGIAMTYLFFTLCCVIYRSADLGMAWNMYRSMFAPETLVAFKFMPEKVALWFGGAIICFYMPNTQQIMRSYSPVLDLRNIQAVARSKFLDKIQWRPSVACSLAILCLYFLSLDILLDANRVQEFIYFQF